MDYLKCGRLEHGFLRVQCDTCHAEHLVAFSCKRRGFCPSCGARRMAESAALLVDEVLPHQPIRQWVLSVPIPLRFLFASRPAIMGKVLGIVYRTIATQLIHQAGHTRRTPCPKHSLRSRGRLSPASRTQASSARFSTTWTGSHQRPRPTHYPNPGHRHKQDCSTRSESPRDSPFTCCPRTGRNS